MGLFDVKGLADANPSFSLGAPLFDKITIHLNPKYYKGETFTITTTGTNDTAHYAQRYLLNGKPIDGIHLPISAITQGGTLTVEMGE